MHDTSQSVASWYFGYYYYADKEVWIDVLLWIFLVVPIALATYWIWEPSRLRGYRLQFWSFLVRKMHQVVHEQDGEEAQFADEESAEIELDGAERHVAPPDQLEEELSFYQRQLEEELRQARERDSSVVGKISTPMPE